MVDVLNVGKWTPQQALLEATGQQENMSKCVVLYMEKGDEMPKLTCSSMSPVDLHFLGFALQNYATKNMGD